MEEWGTKAIWLTAIRAELSRHEAPTKDMEVAAEAVSQALEAGMIGAFGACPFDAGIRALSTYVRAHGRVTSAHSAYETCPLSFSDLLRRCRLFPALTYVRPCADTFSA